MLVSRTNKERNVKSVFISALLLTLGYTLRIVVEKTRNYLKSRKVKEEGEEVSFSENRFSNVIPLDSYRKMPDSLKRDLVRIVASIPPYEFEYLTAELYKILGYTTLVTPRNCDGGKDVIAKKDGVSTYIECKMRKKGRKPGRPELQKLCGAMFADNTPKGALVSFNGFAHTCKEYIEKVQGKTFTIEEISCLKVEELLDKCYLENKEELLRLINLYDKTKGQRFTA